MLEWTMKNEVAFNDHTPRYVHISTEVNPKRIATIHVYLDVE